MNVSWKMQMIGAVAIGLACLGSPRCYSEPTNYVEQIQRAAESLDELLQEEARTVVRFDSKGQARKVKVKPVRRQSLIPTLAYMFNMPQEMLAKAFIRQKYKLSEILFARHLAEKKAEPFEQALSKRTFENWMQALEEAKIPLNEVLDSLDLVYAEVAFLALDQKR